jgi:signal recognition particle GTPase
LGGHVLCAHAHVETSKALAERFDLPVHAIGLGDRAEDLRPFAAPDFARLLMGLDG